MQDVATLRVVSQQQLATYKKNKQQKLKYCFGECEMGGGVPDDYDGDNK